MILRPYQETMLEAARSHMRAGLRRVLLVAPTGAGKRIIAVSAIQTAVSRGKRCGFLVHRQELLDQSSATLAEAGVPHGIIKAGVRPDGRHLCQVASVQSLARREVVPFDFLFADECFPPGTLVDGKPIETIITGDKVRSFSYDGTISSSRVTRTLKRKCGSLVRIVLASGAHVVSTPSHPVFTPIGWRMVGDLAPGSAVFIDPMLDVRINRRIPERRKILLLEEERQGLLLGRMRPAVSTASLLDNDGKDQSAVCVSEDDRTESYAARGSPDKVVENAARYGARSVDTRRERERAHASTDDVSAGVGSRVDNRVYIEDGTGPRVGVSEPLQNRHRKFPDENSYRGGRLISRLAHAAEPGRQEDGSLAISRVESVEILKQGDNGEFERLCPGGLVYNLEVASTHTYFANSVAVHNCHHAPATTWAAIMDAQPDAFVLGFTATPIRLDARGLAKQFQAMVVGPSMRELIDQGYLADYKLYAPPPPDLTGVHTVAGEYDRAELAAMVDRPRIVGDAVQHYLKYAPHTQALCFAVNIAHSKHLAEEFVSRGVRAMHADGETPKEERRQILRDFEAGRFQVLCSVDILGEGLDVAGIEAVIGARPTKSLTVCLQQWGRGLRVKPSGQPCIILDHAGNSRRHGLPDEDRAWELTDDRIKLRSPDEVPITTCPECFMVVPAGTEICPDCGAVLGNDEDHDEKGEGKGVGRGLKHEEGELVAVGTLAARLVPKKLRPIEDFEEIGLAHGFKPGWAYRRWLEQAATLEELQALGRQKGYKPGWAKHVWQGRHRVGGDQRRYV